MQPAAFGFSCCASDREGGGREVEEHRSCVRVGGGGGRGGNKKEIGLLLCEPAALRLIQSQCSVQGRLRVSWV